MSVWEITNECSAAGTINRQETVDGTVLDRTDHSTLLTTAWTVAKVATAVDLISTVNTRGDTASDGGRIKAQGWGSSDFL